MNCGWCSVYINGTLTYECTECSNRVCDSIHCVNKYKTHKSRCKTCKRISDIKDYRQQIIERLDELVGSLNAYNIHRTKFNLNHALEILNQ